MITPDTGEVSFADGLGIVAHSTITELLDAVPSRTVSTRSLPVPGWSQHLLGEHPSSHGPFLVEVATGSEGRVEGVFLSHNHSFYEPDTVADSERRTFHEGVIASDLRGQREFSWGHVFCRVDPEANRDWLVLIYSPFCNVPLREKEVYKVLIEYERARRAG